MDISNWLKEVEVEYLIQSVLPIPQQNTLFPGVYYIIFLLRYNYYELTVHVFLYDSSSGISNLFIKQATQKYVIATNRFNLLNNSHELLIIKFDRTILDYVYQWYYV